MGLEMSDKDVLGLRDAWMERSKTIKTREEFDQFLTEMIEFKHDYSTVIYAMAAAMMAAMRQINNGPCGGITGFQAGCLGWEMAHEFMNVKRGEPARIMNYQDLLYPQYADKFTSISKETWDWVQKKANEKLVEGSESDVSARVWEHWHFVANGNVPFGLKVIDR